MPAAELIYLIVHEFPQFWQRQIFWFFTTSFAVPVLFFQTRLESPSVHIAVKPRAALFMWPPKPTPDFLVLLDTCCMVIVTFSLPQFGHVIFFNLIPFFLASDAMRSMYPVFFSPYNSSSIRSTAANAFSYCWVLIYKSASRKAHFEPRNFRPPLSQAIQKSRKQCFK